MPEIADKLRRVDTMPRFARIRDNGIYDVILPWDELCDFLELAEQIETPDGISPHEWAIRKTHLGNAVRGLNL